MLRRMALVAVIALLFGNAMYTTIGCAPGTYSPSEPTIPIATIIGTVFDARTGALITNKANAIEVKQGGSTLFGSIGADGMWTLTSFDPGSVRITITVSGYQTLISNATLTQGDNHLDFRLQPVS